MEVAKAVNKFLIPDMSREIYKWVFQDALNKIGQYQETDSALERLKFERNVTFYIIENSKFKGPEIETTILKIHKGGKFRIDKYRNYEFIIESLSKLPVPIFENKEEKDKEFGTLVGAFLALIDLTIQYEKLELEIEDLRLHCHICEQRIVSTKVINCRTCGTYCDDLYCCTPCVPKMYHDNYDPYLCSSCS